MTELDRTYPARVVSGSITYDGATSQNIQFLNVLENIITNSPFTASIDGSSWWSVYDSISTGSTTYNKTFLSRGNPDYSSGSVQGGDTRIYASLQHNGTTGITVAAYLDWSDSTSSGVNQSSATNLTITTNTTINYAIFINEYEILVRYEQAAASGFLYFGQPIRSHVQLANRGRCFTTQTASAGSNVTVTIDRDMTNTDSANLTGSLVKGAPVWIVALTPSGAPTSPYTYEITTIQDLTTGSITLSSISNSYSSSALIGVDPIPTFMYGGTNLTGNKLGVSAITGEYRGVNLNQHAFNVFTGYPETSIDHVDGNDLLYFGTRVAFNSVSTNNIGARGTSGIICAWSTPSSASIVRGDVFRENFDNGKIYWPFTAGATTSGFTHAVLLPSGTSL